jgi:hypothetical protein
MWKRLFANAKHKKYFTGDNPAQWTENLDFRFPFLKQIMSTLMCAISSTRQLSATRPLNPLGMAGSVFRFTCPAHLAASVYQCWFMRLFNIVYVKSGNPSITGRPPGSAGEAVKV